MAGSCVTELAATITYNIYIQGEKTILAASDVERLKQNKVLQNATALAPGSMAHQKFLIK